MTSRNWERHNATGTPTFIDTPSFIDTPTLLALKLTDTVVADPDWKNWWCIYYTV